jgi:hypothetical protein
MGRKGGQALGQQRWRRRIRRSQRHVLGLRRLQCHGPYEQRLLYHPRQHQRLRQARDSRPYRQVHARLRRNDPDREADGNYLSRFWFNLSDMPVVEQSGFGIANLRVNYTPQSGKLEVGASVENVADKHYGVMGFDNTSINGLAQIYPGMPRWFKVHVNYKFKVD